MLLFLIAKGFGSTQEALLLFCLSEVSHRDRGAFKPLVTNLCSVHFLEQGGAVCVMASEL